MSERVAGVGITLRDAGFSSGLAAMVGKTKTAGGQMQSAVSGAFSNAGKAFGGVKNAIGSAMGAAGGIGGLGAVMGVSALVNEAIQAEKRFRNLASAVTVSGKGVADYRSIMSAAQATAQKWGVSTEDVAAAMSTMFRDSGDLQQTISSMDRLAMLSQATGKPMEQLSGLVFDLSDKFGVADDQINETMSSLLAMTSDGNVSIDVVAGSMDKLARASKLAGVEGADGLRQMVAVAKEIESVTGDGSGAIDLTTQVMAKLKANEALQKELKTKHDIDAKGNPLDVLKAIMDKGEKSPDGALKILGGVLKADQAAILSQALGGGGIDRALKTSAVKGANLEALGGANSQSGAAEIQRSIEALKTAFTQPQLLSSLTSLAALLPSVVDKFTSVVEFVSDHKMAAAFVAVTLRLGLLSTALEAASASATRNAAAQSLPGGGGAGLVKGAPGAVAAGPGMGATLAPAAAMLGIAAALDQYEQLQKEKQEYAAERNDEAQRIIADQVSSGKVIPQMMGNNRYRMMTPTQQREDGSWEYTSEEFDGADQLKRNDRGEIDWEASSMTEDGAGRTFKTNRLDRQKSLAMQAEDSMAEARERKRRMDVIAKNPMDMVGLGIGEESSYGLGLIGKPAAKPGAGPGAGPAGKSSSGPQEVKTPELVGLLRGGIVVSLNPASAAAIGDAVAGKISMPEIRPRKGTDDHG